MYRPDQRGIRLLALILCLAMLSCLAGQGDHSLEALSRQGSTGAQVRSIQRRLIALGYLGGEADGIVGSGTRSALIRFQ